MLGSSRSSLWRMSRERAGVRTAREDNVMMTNTASFSTVVPLADFSVNALLDACFLILSYVPAYT